MNRSISIIFALTILTFSSLALAKDEKNLWDALVNNRIDEAIGHYSRNQGDIDFDYSEDGRNTLGSLLNAYGIIRASGRPKCKPPIYRKPMGRSASMGDLKNAMFKEKLIRDSVNEFFAFAKQRDEEIAAREAAARNTRRAYLISVDQLDPDKFATIINILGCGSVLYSGDWYCVVYTTNTKAMLLQDYEWVEGIDYYTNSPESCLK